MVSSWGWAIWDIWIISAKGANFCQVAIISPVGRSSPCITGGIQKCIGASPTFSARAMVINVIAMGWLR